MSVGFAAVTVIRLYTTGTYGRGKRWPAPDRYAPVPHIMEQDTGQWPGHFRHVNECPACQWFTERSNPVGVIK
jgi:hypothetical protein